DGIRDLIVTGVQTCALPISSPPAAVELVLRNVRREYWFVRFSIILRWWSKRTERPFADKHGIAFFSSDLIARAKQDLSSFAGSRSEERRVGKECGCGWEVE